MQLAVPKLRTASGLRVFNAALKRHNHNLFSWRESEHLPAREVINGFWLRLSALGICSSKFGDTHLAVRVWFRGTLGRGSLPLLQVWLSRCETLFKREACFARLLLIACLDALTQQECSPTMLRQV